MLNDKELEKYFKKHKISIATQQYIRMVRDSEPSRLVGRQAGNNVCTGFSSRKMGRSIQTESRTAEFPFAIEFEYDDSVLEFWEQPQPLPIYRTYKNGVVRPGSYTPDFLLITEDGPLIVEVKTDENLAKLAKKNPQDWMITKEGVTYRPAKEAFAKIGLDFKVNSTAQINLVRTENLKFLLNSRRADKAWDEAFYQLVMKELANHSWIKISDLAKLLKISDLTPLIQMIDEGILHVSLSDELLSQPESTWISSSLELVILGLETRKNDHLSSNDTAVSLEKIPSKKQAERTLEILSKIKSGEKGRSIRRWRETIEKGREEGLTPFQSLLPKYFLSGNRDARLNTTITSFIQQFIKNRYSKTDRIMPEKTYRLYKNLAKKAHPSFPPVSKATLRSYIKMGNQQRIARGRGGKRAANAAAHPTKVSDRGFLATAPFQLASLDHCLLDQECVVAVSNGITYTAKPWLTAMVDVNSKDVLAIWLSFRTPSSRACGMIMRMCVKNHGRLPKAIIVDGGSEFQSVYFDSLLSHFEIDLMQRPLSHPRFGSEIERFFLLYKTEWLSLRPGNTAMYKESRSVSGSHTPAKNASLSIEDTWNEIGQYIEWRNDLIVGNEKLSPKEKLSSALEQYSFLGVNAEYGHELKLLTAVDCGLYKVDPYRGINIDSIHYWSPDLTKYSSLNKRVEVRYEPENPHQIYARVFDKWITCYATQHNVFKTKDPVVRLAESVRILDCRAIRDAAKEEANQSLIDNILELDEQYQLQQRNTGNTNEGGTNQSPAQSPTSIFKHLMDTPIEKINAQKWEA